MWDAVIPTCLQMAQFCRSRGRRSGRCRGKMEDVRRFSTRCGTATRSFRSIKLPASTGPLLFLLQRKPLQQIIRLHPRRLPPVKDRLNEIWREQGQPQHAALWPRLTRSRFARSSIIPQMPRSAASARPLEGRGRRAYRGGRSFSRPAITAGPAASQQAGPVDRDQRVAPGDCWARQHQRIGVHHRRRGFLFGQCSGNGSTRGFRLGLFMLNFRPVVPGNSRQTPLPPFD